MQQYIYDTVNFLQNIHKSNLSDPHIPVQKYDDRHTDNLSSLEVLKAAKLTVLLIRCDDHVSSNITISFIVYKISTIFSGDNLISCQSHHDR